MGAGFPPFFPPLDEKDSAFTVMTALAYGLRGFNMYMAVERDRWIGAPIDPQGRERPFALFWRKLVQALEKVRFHELKRRVPVRILTPRNERRLARVMHAFGPISAAFFSVLGAGARESAIEDDLGLGFPPAVEADTFTRTLENALDSRGVPFAHIGGEDRDVSLEGASWIVCVSSGGLSKTLFARLAEAADRRTLVTIGPRAPELGGARRPLVEPLDTERLRGPFSDHDVILDADPASVEGAVAHAIDRLDLPTLSVEPDAVYATLHEDADGKPRVLFLINPADIDVTARVSVGAGPTRAVDLMKEQSYVVQQGALEVTLKPKSVRMLALS
jgi:beta-galactosidase